MKLDELEKKIGISFKSKDLLTKAFTHRSYLNESRKIVEHNERLEFLGDAVLELSVSDYLFKKFPDEMEGYMTSLRAALVNTISLSEVANELGFEKYLLLSKGEAKETGRGKRHTMANTMESLIGAIYLDQGYNQADKFVIKNIIENKLDEIIKEEKFRDAKSLFQEKAQAEKGVTPEYKIIKEWGPDHNKKFISGVFLGKNLIAEGEGLSKQESETEAAKKALDVNGW